MSQFDIIYDSSKVESLQFYNSATNKFMSSEEAQSLSDQGLGRIVIGGVSTSCSVIVYDPTSTYWECYYNTDTDKFLCETDANTLVEIGLGRIVTGKIPYIITKEKGIYFDVVKDKRVSEQNALQLVSSGVAVLKNKDCEEEDKFVDASETNPSTDNQQTLNSSLPPAPSSQHSPSSRPPSLSSHNTPSTQPASQPQTSRQVQSQSSLNSAPRGTAHAPSSAPSSSSLRQHPSTSSSAPSSSTVQEEKEESLFEKVAPIAAGVAVAGVAIAGVAAAMFFGSGGKDKKRKK